MKRRIDPFLAGFVIFEFVTLTLFVYLKLRSMQ